MITEETEKDWKKIILLPCGCKWKLFVDGSSEMMNRCEKHIDSEIAIPNEARAEL